MKNLLVGNTERLCIMTQNNPSLNILVHDKVDIFPFLLLFLEVWCL
jgi:hypothetical protein